MRSSTLIAVLVFAVASLQHGAAAALPAGGGVLLQQAVAQFTAASRPMLQASQAFSAAAKSQFAEVAEQMGAVLDVMEAKYCSPPMMLSAKKKPAMFVGQGFALSFSTGNCTFNETKFLANGTKELDCTKPSITYVKTPANFTSHYISGPRFVTKECKVEKTFGEQVDKVLYVFDNTKPMPDAATLVQRVNQEIANMMGSMSSNMSTTSAAALLAGA